MTLYAKLVAQQNDGCGYCTYVFENLECKDSNKYIMCVRFPNWNHRLLKIDDEGFLTVKEVREGIDTWFNGITNVFYNYSNVIFINFINKSIETNEIILD